MAALEAFDRLGLLKLISPALTGAKLNTAGLAKFEKLAHSVLPPGTAGGWLAFLTVLTEKLNPRERAELLRAFELPKTETEALKKSGIAGEETGIDPEVGADHPAFTRV